MGFPFRLGWFAMPRLMPGIHHFLASFEDVNGRD
jgi:hypothetical protein